MSDRYEFPRFKAAAVQAGPVLRDAPQWFDTDATLDKAIALIDEASKNGARLIVFPEGWLPCFTYWSIDFRELPAFRDMWAKYLWSSVEVPSPETDALCAAAKRANAYVVMGINERDKMFRGRMYNSILYLNPRGEIMGTHRKICNTVSERLFHTPGDGGDNLKTVFKTEIGNIGGSICGEHEQLPMIYYWIMQGIEIHCSLWPGTVGMENVIDILTRAVCLNARAFGVLAAAYLPENNRPRNFSQNSLLNFPNTFRGGSGVVSPRGEYIAGPVYDQETIVYGDIDLSDIDRERYAVNLVGIYSRWDLINISVRQECYAPVFPIEAKDILLPASEPSRVRDLEAQLKKLEQQLSRLVRKPRSK